VWQQKNSTSLLLLMMHNGGQAPAERHDTLLSTPGLIAECDEGFAKLPATLSGIISDTEAV
jgi:hypothetical protein